MERPAHAKRHRVMDSYQGTASRNTGLVESKERIADRDEKQQGVAVAGGLGEGVEDTLTVGRAVCVARILHKTHA